MNPDKQRIAIAEACGWRVKKNMGGTHGFKPNHQMFECAQELPDYINDLNAMHDAENGISDKSYADYVRLLQGAFLEITKGRTYIGAHSATAAQRAEAFLRTIGKWETQ